jgi:hypothetical protein
MSRLTLRIIVGGFTLYLGGQALGRYDWTLGADLALAVLVWIIYLELVLAGPLRRGRGLVRVREARAAAAAATALECRDLSARVMDDDFKATTVAPGELALTLDTAADLLEKGGR